MQSAPCEVWGLKVCFHQVGERQHWILINIIPSYFVQLPEGNKWMKRKAALKKQAATQRKRDQRSRRDKQARDTRGIRDTADKHENRIHSLDLEGFRDFSLCI